MTDEELKKEGANDSLVHEDFSDELRILKLWVLTLMVKK